MPDEPRNVHRERLAPLAHELVPDGATVAEELVALHDRIDAAEAQGHHDRDDLEGLRARVEALERILGGRIPE